MQLKSFFPAFDTIQEFWLFAQQSCLVKLFSNMSFKFIVIVENLTF